MSVTVCPRDGTKLNAGLNLDPAFVNYEFLETIGEGGMGVIYKARHLILNKFVAIKTLHTHLVSPSAIRRFQVEGKAESLLSHPNIVSFHDLGVTQSGQPYIIMEYIDGETLAEVLRREGQLPLPRFLKIFWQICDGLSLAHKKSILHRDIKPTNIMLVHDRGEDEVRIMDFGIAKMMDDTTAGAQQITKTGDMVGSPIYMSPEQARGLQTDQRSDLYSLGCVMYESLTGSPPFHGNTALDTVLMHLDSKPVPMKEASLGREVDPRIERVVMRLLEKNPGDRYQSMDELKEALVPFARPDLTNTHRLLSGATKTKKADAPRIKGVIVTSAAILLIACGALAYLALKKERTRKEPPMVAATGATTIKQKTGVHTTSAGSWSDSRFKPWNAPALDFEPTLLEDEIRRNRPELKLTDLFEDWDKLRDKDLAPLRNSNARVINLEPLHITDKTLEYLKNSAVLRYLILSNTDVYTLRPLKNMKLADLTLEYTTLSPEAYVNIASMKDLGYLNLKHTNTSDDNLQSLEKMKDFPSLSKVVLGDCAQLTLKGVDRFQNVLPKAYANYFPPHEIGETGDGLLSDAKSAMKQKHWSQASSRAAQALGTNQLSPTDQVAAGMIRGDCLVKENLPVSALLWYAFAGGTLEKVDPYNIELPRICVTRAAIMESFTDKKHWSPAAADERVKASKLFEKSLPAQGKERELCLKDWQDNLQAAAHDYEAMKQHAKAEEVLRQLRNVSR